MLNQDVRVAVVGLGKMGLLHTSILNVLPQVDVVAICEKSGMARKVWRKVLKEIKIVDDVHKLTDLNLDAAYITTPIPSHFSIAETLYTKNLTRNLFVEKTLASNHEEAKELCRLANHLGGVNMVGYLRRFAVTFRKARNLLRQEIVGEPIDFAAHAYSSDFHGANIKHDTPASRGGVLRDLGCHAIDLATWFFGDLEVDGVKIESAPDDTSGDVWHFTTRRSDGIAGDLKTSWCVSGFRMPEVGLRINCSKGSIEVNDDMVRLRPHNDKPSTLFKHDLKDTSPFWLGGTEYFREDDHFIKSIRERGNAEPNFDMAAKVDHIIDDVQSKAGETGG